MFLRWIPNLLTLSRCGLGLLVLLACIKVAYAQECVSEHLGKDDCNKLVQFWAQLALFAFVSGVITDFLDGWSARWFNAETRFGVWLDPIADKLLVAAALAGLSIIYHALVIVIPAIVIIARDIFITGFRMTQIGKKVVQVSTFAKQKTALEMVAITLLILPLALTSSSDPYSPVELADYFVGVLFVLPLWIASAMSVISLVKYLKQAIEASHED